LTRAFLFVPILCVSSDGQKSFSNIPVTSRDVTYQTLPGREL
jgi:hypothetical protein